MLTDLFADSLRRQRRSFTGWAIATALLVCLMSAMWPSVENMGGLEEFLESYPEPLRELFRIEDLGTATGFLNAELYSIMLPAMFIVYGVGRGARTIAGDEESGLLETVLATPVTRWQVVLDKALALAASVVGLALVLVVASVLSTAVVGMDVGVGDHVSAALAMAALGVFFGWIALGVGAVTGRRERAIAVSGTLAGAGYLAYALGAFVSAAESLRPLSPFHHLLGPGPLGSDTGPQVVVVLLISVLVLAASVPPFLRRDIAG